MPRNIAYTSDPAALPSRWWQYRPRIILVAAGAAMLAAILMTTAFTIIGLLCGAVAALCVAWMIFLGAPRTTVIALLLALMSLMGLWLAPTSWFFLVILAAALAVAIFRPASRRTVALGEAIPPADPWPPKRPAIIDETGVLP